MARKVVDCLTFGDKIPSKSIKLKKIQLYVILFEEQFNDKIFEINTEMSMQVQHPYLFGKHPFSTEKSGNIRKSF